MRWEMAIDDMTQHQSISPFRLSATVALVVMFVGSAPAFAGKRSCDGIGSLRSEASETRATIEVTNRRSTPLAIELIGESGTTVNYLVLAPGENRHLLTYRTHVWVSRDARRRCLSGFVSEQESENWEITSTLDGDYERRNVRSFPVYVAAEFGKHQNSLLERSLEVLDAEARRIEDIIPSAAWHRISRIPIWLEYEPDPSYGGRYLPASPKWLAAYDIPISKAGSIQFTSSLAVMVGSQQNLLMHELAHAYHDLVLSYSHPQIGTAFERAQASGRYNAVRGPCSWARAYAISNHMEFFAELSVAYFGTNAFFPFTRDDLKAFDPDSYRVIADAWERPPEETPRQPLWSIRSEVGRSPGWPRY
jgi:hypothetical protein